MQLYASSCSIMSTNLGISPGDLPCVSRCLLCEQLHNFVNSCLRTRPMFHHVRTCTTPLCRIENAGSPIIPIQFVDLILA